jgi:hypothetical protein
MPHLTVLLAVCLFSAGCTAFRHDQRPTAQDYWDRPITREQHDQAVAESQPSWFQSLFGSSNSAKPQQKMEEFVGQARPGM